MPRLKDIHRQRLYLPESGLADSLEQLRPVERRSIDWTLIAQQYDEIIKFTTALRLGTADAESVLRRFTRSNIKHPTAELGKAVKTIYLCDYLSILETRREVQEGLNVMENWNSANGFIFFGKGSEFQR